MKLIVVGKIKDEYITKGINEYVKRLRGFCNFNLIEVKEYVTDDILKNLMLEGKHILDNIDKSDYVVILKINGKQLSSEEFAKFISDHYTYSSKDLVFVIGSSHGLDDEVLKRSDYDLSFSKMTFPHQLMRLIFSEQLYRAYSIINNQKYHK